jgi:hypothetical protein
MWEPVPKCVLKTAMTAAKPGQASGVETMVLTYYTRLHGSVARAATDTSWAMVQWTAGVVTAMHDVSEAAHNVTSLVQGQLTTKEERRDAVPRTPC